MSIIPYYPSTPCCPTCGRAYGTYGGGGGITTTISTTPKPDPQIAELTRKVEELTKSLDALLAGFKAGTTARKGKR